MQSLFITCHHLVISCKLDEYDVKPRGENMSKPLWIILLVATGILAVWRSARGIVAFWEYTRLSTAVAAQVGEVVVVSKGAKYALETVYNYRFAGALHTNQAQLKGPYYLNRTSAEQAADRLRGTGRIIYLDPDRPQQSALEHAFPLRQVIDGACLTGVFMYFVCLSIYLKLGSRAHWR